MSLPEAALRWREEWEKKEARCDYARALRDVERITKEIGSGNVSQEKLARLERALREVQQTRSEVEKLNVRENQVNENGTNDRE
jgi:hypothetical protein